MVRKIQGRRAVTKKTHEELEALEAQGKKTKNVSSSQMSYDSRLDSFDKLIKMLASIKEYAPNEADLKVAALTAVYKDLQAKNAAAVITQVPLKNARITRNEVLYSGDTNIFASALDCKTYLKSAFGAESA